MQAPARRKTKGFGSPVCIRAAGVLCECDKPDKPSPAKALPPPEQHRRDGRTDVSAQPVPPEGPRHRPAAPALLLRPRAASASTILSLPPSSSSSSSEDGKKGSPRRSPRGRCVVKGLWPCHALRRNPAPCSSRTLRAYVTVLASLRLTQPTILCANRSADGGCHHLGIRKGGFCKDASARICVCPRASPRSSWDHS